MSHLRRLCALVAVGTLSFAGLTVAGSPAQAAATPDPRPVTIGAGWLASQLTKGVVHNDQYDFDDFGLTLDAGISFASVDVGAPGVAVIAQAVAARPTEPYDSFGTVYTGSAAKEAVFAQLAGEDPGNFGGVDLIGVVEANTATAAPIAGRIQNVNELDYSVDPPVPGDSANVFGQAFAARALANDGSTKADDAIEFLLEQQCAAGYFRLKLTKDKTALDQTCDGGTAGDSAPDTDATALAVLQLAAIDDPSPAVAADIADALDDAEAWLLAAQHADGSFGGGTSTEAPNTNSTGLAGWALGVLGADSAAARAAVWVRSHQADEPTACPSALSGQTGAIGYDDAAVAAGRTDGITVPLQDQWRRSTAPILPVLQWAPRASASLDISGPSGYLEAGRAVTFQVTGAAPGAQVCLSGVGAPRISAAPASGGFAAAVTMPAGTATRVVTASLGAGSSASQQVQVLGATRLRVRPASDRVHRGARLRVVVRGLAPGESVALRVHGVTVRSGNADLDGRFVKRVRPGRELGKVRIVARGEFPTIRHGRAVVRVVR